jgi:hypothetical protein
MFNGRLGRLLLGFAGAFRGGARGARGGSELVALDVADIEVVTEGLLITIRRSKTDQEGQGRKVAIRRDCLSGRGPEGLARGRRDGIAYGGRRAIAGAGDPRGEVWLSAS